MKSNFIVSVYLQTWIKNCKRIFLAEPYVYQYLDINDKLQDYDEVLLAPHLRISREDLIRDHNYVYEKYKFYIPILAAQLNRIHGTDHSVIFWQKCLSLSLVRYITFLYDMFQQCRALDPKLHDCRILSENSYYIPKDFNDHRDFIQNTAFGQEQIFSIYIHLFYPSTFEPIEAEFSWPVIPLSKKENKYRYYLNRLRRVTLLKLLGKLLDGVCRIRNPRVAIIECFFSTKNLISLILKSNGQIQHNIIQSDFKYNEKVDRESREVLSSISGEFDAFDDFFIASLKHCFPKIFIEEFSKIHSSYDEKFKRFSKMKYVVNESWIGNNYAAIAVAILEAKGIKHICNEHNYLSHHFLGNNNKYLYPLVHKFVTLGWFDESISNLVRGSSLYEWAESTVYLKEHSIAFITGIPPIKTPEISAAYGSFGSFNAEKHLEFLSIFFSHLASSTLNRILYRGYPIDAYASTHIVPQMVRYDQDYVLKKYLDQVKMIDYSSQSGKTLMKKSRLVIVDYLSTSYLESIIANIPTVFFWNKQSYYIEGKYSNIYEPLVSVGICQSNPIKAAGFIEEIMDNPESWWFSDEVQTARKNFLDANFGPTDVLKRYILELCNKL